MKKTNFFEKIIYSLILFLTITTLSMSSLATSDTPNTDGNTNDKQSSYTDSNGATTTFELVEDKSCHIDLDDSGTVDKKLTSFDATTRSATLTLTVKNTKQVSVSQKAVEVFLVVDNSSSMSDSVGDITRKQAVINSANLLIDKLFSVNPHAKVGVVSFSSLDTTKGEVEGTINDAKLTLALSDSKDEVSSAISSIETHEAGIRTNIDAGITIASQNYSKEENINRYLVLLTDGVPNNDTQGNFQTYVGNVATNTKSKLQEIEASGITVIGSMIGLDSDRVEPQSKKTYRALAEEIFGTVDNPTISSYYYIPDNEIQSTIADKIYSDLITIEENNLKNIVVKDYFPQEIIDNFNFEYVASPNIGNVSQEIDKTDNSITWRIELLKAGEVATLSYKLTLKPDYNKEIVDKIIPTNSKVDASAETDDGTKIEKTSDDSPTVRVLYTVPPTPAPEPEPTPAPETPKKDKTVAPKQIPQTGQSSLIIVFIVVFVITSFITSIGVIYFKKNKIK